MLSENTCWYFYLQLEIVEQGTTEIFSQKNSLFLSLSKYSAVLNLLLEYGIRGQELILYNIV